MSSWPQSLKSALSLCLGSKFPMALYWGPHFVILYNDAWAPILGARHPAGLGTPGREVWPELWSEIGPQYQSVLDGGPPIHVPRSLLVMQRHGYNEECYFNYQLSPVLGEGGRVDGVLNAVHEITFQVISERRSKLITELTTRLHGVRTVEEVFSRTAALLQTADRDVAFFALYRETEGPVAASPSISGITFPSSDTLSAVDVPPGVVGTAWPEPVKKALVVPLLGGRLVLGISPRRPLDDEYVLFARQLADQLNLALTSATAFEAEARRAEALAALDRAKTQFFANVSHEFRTPLTLMLGPTTDALTAKRPLEGEQLGGVHRNQLRLLKLVNTLLDFSRIEAGRAQARYQPTDFSGLTTALASAFESLLASAKLTYEVDAKPIGEPVFLDRGMFEKILLNLLSNAFKFTFEGVVKVATFAREGRAVLEVSDTGTGIPERELPNLFKRFHRVEGAKGRSYEGTGIGLALVQELARLHGGDVEVKSTLGKGTTFTVWFPLGSAHLPKEHVDTSSEAPSLQAAGAFLAEASQWVQGPGEAVPASTDAPPGPRVLLADDNREMREYVRSLLEGQGYQVETATDGHAALERARSAPPDIVISDVMMPGLDGFGLIKALKADARTRMVPVCLLSARAGDVSAAEGIDAGADEYLAKPFSARELLSRVRGLINAASARREAENERARLQALLEGVPAVINFLRGPELVFEFAHPNAERATGRRLKGRALLEALPEHRDQRYHELLQQVLRTGQPASGFEQPLQLPRADGEVETRYWNYSYLPIRDRSGNIEGVMTFDIDVTGQVRARQQVETLLQELQDADRRKDDFLAMLGHELRNPMAAISIALSALARGPADPARTSRHVAIAQRQMGHLSRLVDDLLDVARITRGKVELKRGPCDFASLVTAAVAAMRPTLEAREHRLSVELAPAAFPIDADATRIEQVITNLLTNAAKYTDKGGRITVTLERQGNDGVLRVKDTGRGIPRKMLGKVFEAFVQVSPTIDRSTGGLGLGLTLVKRLVELHGGSVGALSDGEGKGSEFLVRLPLATQPLPVQAAAVKPDSDGKTPAVRILLVEDSEDLREMLTALLEEMGHRVDTAKDGLEGLERLLELRPDVALIDVGLPKLDGFELARRARAHERGEGLFLIALTGYGGSETKASAKEAGFNLHLTKPLDVDALGELLASVTVRQR